MKRHATSIWKGDVKSGSGVLTSQSGTLSDTAYSFSGRFSDEEGKNGTNPEELIAAAHSGCFNMALSKMLSEAGFPPEELTTSRWHYNSGCSYSVEGCYHRLNRRR